MQFGDFQREECREGQATVPYVVFVGVQVVKMELGSVPERGCHGVAKHHIEDALVRRQLKL